MVAFTKEGAKGLGDTINELEDFFYAYDGLVELPHPERLQMAFDVLTELFDRIGLCKTCGTWREWPAGPVTPLEDFQR